MATNHPKAGPNSVPAYQLSGIPFVTASSTTEVPGTNTIPIKLELPYVTRFFQIENIGSDPIRVGFSADGVKGSLTANYFVVTNGEKSDVLELRTKDLFFNTDHATNTTGYRLIAGLTTIDRSNFPVLTGSVNGTGSFDGIG